MSKRTRKFLHHCCEDGDAIALRRHVAKCIEPSTVAPSRCLAGNARIIEAQLALIESTGAHAQLAFNGFPPLNTAHV
jgi:hypothetical protein